MHLITDIALETGDQVRRQKILRSNRVCVKPVMASYLERFDTEDVLLYSVCEHEEVLRHDGSVDADGDEVQLDPTRN